ncbi:hypothetical protein ACP70R_034747 [Stipagrostis hirtigluma subsp. patula]
MKVVIMVVVALVAAAGASAQQVGWPEQPPPQVFYGGVGQSMTSPCAELLRQQCPVVAASPWQPPPPQQGVCQPLRQQCCAQLRQTQPHYRCQAICGVVQAVVQQLQIQQQQMQPMPLYDPSSPPMMLQPPQIGIGAAPLQPALAVAQVAQSLPAMCGLYPVPSTCTTPCALAAIQQPVGGIIGMY